MISPKRIVSVLAACAVAYVSAAAEAAEPQTPADVVLTGGRVVTLDPARPEAEALAARRGRIVAVGSRDDVAPWIGSATEVIDLDGRLLIPGFIESHGHLTGIGQSRQQLDLVGTTSEAQIAAVVAARAAEVPRGRWILGRGWDQNDWATHDFPTHESLTAAAPEHPVLLTRIDGHCSWANAEALRRASIDAATPDPPGGKIIRDADGRATGVLIDRAQDLVRRHLPEATHAERKEAMLLAIDECLEHGITSFHDAGVGREEIAIYRELLAEGRLGLRCYVMLRGPDANLLEEHFRIGPEIGLGDDRLTIRSIKLVADGALGSRGAALFDEYDDAPGYRGLTILSEDQIFAVADQALAHGFQVCTHAIGDRTNHLVLNAYERAFDAHPEVRDPRFRVEHAQILAPSDVPRFAALGVIASIQATHCTSDMPWAPDRLGDARTRERAYVWRDLLASGARIANGSDAPVESVDPLLGFFASVTRQDQQGKPPGGWSPEQRLTPDEALRSFTLDGAYAAFEESHKGSLEPGKWADLVVLSHDILRAPPSRILETHVDLTIVGGKIVYRRDGRRSR